MDCRSMDQEGKTAQLIGLQLLHMVLVSLKGHMFLLTLNCASLNDKQIGANQELPS